MRIAIGGFQHETNTFAPSQAHYEHFARGGGWPGLCRGGEILETMVACNLPIAGFIEQLKGSAHQLVPTAWAAAEPSAHVTRDAYERIAAMIVDGIREARPDAVYLDLHGAMVAEHRDDGEGELLERVRAVVGPDTPIYASLDLHANVTRRMLACADLMVAYRTYPHIDMAETGARTAFALAQRLSGMARPHCAARRLPFLIPLACQSTDLEPARAIYRAVAALESAQVPSASFTPGFPAADFPECGPVVFAYGNSDAAAQQAVQTLERLVAGHEADFDAPVYDADAAVRKALAVAARSTRPVVIADTQDNPGAGGESDTTGMLRALLQHGAGHTGRGAALGLMADGAAAQAAHHAGPGATITLALGGRSGIRGDAPLQGSFRVERLSEGTVVCTGPFSRGSTMHLGPSACLSIEGVRVVVVSTKTQLADQELYRFVGIEPTEQGVLVNKSSVHFRADFTPIAQEILVAKAPGPMIHDPSEFAWTRLPPGLRLRPQGPAFRP
ncbi:MAG: M81 family metallopeptidase [Rhodoferax sp.]|nr:M81 family metallopeptidase [Rhodoferax sp.]